MDNGSRKILYIRQWNRNSKEIDGMEELLGHFKEIDILEDFYTENLRA
jgi:hypothetical protein